MASRKELLRRLALLLAGLFITAAGVTLLKKADLGISPNSSIPNVLSERFSAVSLGMWLFLWNVTLIAGQAIALRRNFRARYLLEIPLAYLYGLFADAWMAILSPVLPGAYWARLALTALGVLVLGFGIVLTADAELIMNAGEAFVKAVSEVSGRSFGSVKVAFDAVCVVIAVLISLALFGGEVRGVREGTVIAALIVGLSCGLFRRVLHGKK